MALTQKQVDVVVKRELTRDSADRIMREIRSSLLFQFKWEDLLMSGPIALSCIGACMVAAASPNANVIFEPPKNGFTYLADIGGKYGLKSNLVKSVDLGRFAFIEAESSMGKINMTSANVYNTVDDIMQTLQSPNDARIMLRRQLQSLRNSAADCFEAAKAIDLKFEAWLFHACELYLACISTQASTEDQLVTNEIDLAVTKTSIDYQKQTVDQLKATTNKLEQSLDTATEAYKNASDDFPSGWEILGQQIVGQLADSLNTALNQAIPALVSNMNPMAKAGAITDMASGILGGSKKKDPAAGDQANGTTPPVAPNAPATTRPKDADDPAYNQVARDLTYWELVQTVFLGTDGGIDWDKARGESGNTRESLGFASKMLNNSKSSFANAATMADPSQKYIQALTSVCKIVTAILDELVKARISTYTPPANNSAMVKGWQSDFMTAYARAVELNTTAKSFPGSTATGAGVPGAPIDPAVQTAQIQAKTSLAQAVLESAKNRLNTASAALTATQETYQKSTALLAEQQNKFMELNAALERLKGSNLKLDAIKQILIQCIRLVVKLKNEITNLVRFFKAIATIVQFVMDKHVDPYIATIKAITSGSADEESLFKVGDYTLTDLQRSSCFNSTITIRSYYSIFGDIASMWTELSQDCIFPGIKMVDEISALDPSGDPSMIQKKAAELQTWSQKASAIVAKKAKQKQEKISGAMEARVQDITEKTHLLPPVPDTISHAITAGADTSKQAAQGGMKAEANQSLIFKPLPRDDVY